MLFEFKKILNHAVQCQASSIKCVLASVVDLDGSSYRKPGVRMLITDKGDTVGAVSGGCVEKEVIRQAQQVLEDGLPRIMTYDGRYRLGCEGVLYILIEPFSLSDELLASWAEVLESRLSFEMHAFYSKEIGQSPDYGTIIKLKGKEFTFRKDFSPSHNVSVFSQTMQPALRLVIIGTEHDAVQMAMIGSSSGMEVTVVSSLKDARQKSDFPGADKVIALEPDGIDNLGLDEQTAVILMTHSYSRDFHYALAILDQAYCYFGIIGSSRRKHMLFDELLQYNAELDLDKLESISSPAGLNIGSVTPQEIAISVIAEIIAVVRKKQSSKVINSITVN
ncbi:XdhC family protein [Limibacter armeniacum]|uniref:XdhC family protein n=1 Tax=Limibacter armeniacum TaxID=466084 RepID=UPI002FE514AC